jgi:AcrR family transcriptional regulator
MSRQSRARAAAPSQATATEQADSAGTQAQIFAATERLLEQVPLHDLSVAQIIDEAGVSRATFYFYFGSKYAVIAGLLAGVMDEVYEVARPFIERPDDEPPERALRRGIEAAAVLWSSHRFALRALSEHWYAVPELRELWMNVMARFTEGFAAEIDRQRSAGLAPPGVDSHRLAASLLWSSERCFYVAGLGVDGELGSEDQAVDALYALWRGAIYGGRPAKSARGRSAPKTARGRPAAKTARGRRST